MFVVGSFLASTSARVFDSIRRMWVALGNCVQRVYSHHLQKYKH